MTIKVLLAVGLGCAVGFLSGCSFFHREPPLPRRAVIEAGGSEEKTNYAASKRPWEQQSALVATGNWGAIYDIESPRIPQAQLPPSVPRQ